MIKSCMVGAICVVLVFSVSCGGSSSDMRRVSLADLIGPGRVVIVGEQHGTEQYPSAVGEALAAYDGPAMLGLEIPADERPRIDAYVSANDSDESRRKLTAGRFWTSGDGRSSRAMVDLLDDVRAINEGKGDVTVIPFDVDRFGGAASERDEQMARNIDAAIRAKPKAAMIVLVGDVHASSVEPSAVEGEPYEPMARVLRRLWPDVTSVKGAHAGGTAWQITSPTEGGRMHDVKGTRRTEERNIVILDAPEGYDGVLYVGRVTASRPARDS